METNLFNLAIAFFHQLDKVISSHSYCQSHEYKTVTSDYFAGNFYLRRTAFQLLLKSRGLGQVKG